MALLQDKVAVVTGSGQGIGRGIALRFAREGAKVILAEIGAEAGRAVEREIGEFGGTAKFVQTDVSKKDQIEAMIAAAVEQFGRLDILVNNAVKLPTPVDFESKTDEMLEEQLKLGVWATWWGMRAALPIMRDQGGGRIINMTSIDADTGAWLHADYSIAKAGIASMTRSAALDWGRYDILVNAIAPTAASAAFEKMCEKKPSLREEVKVSRPIGRLGDPEDDIAPVAVMLASDLGHYVTGTVIPVDGGKHMPRGGLVPPRTK